MTVILSPVAQKQIKKLDRTVGKKFIVYFMNLKS
jgi:hypothetical protein